MITNLSGRWHKIYTCHYLIFNVNPRINYSWVSEAEVKVGKVP
jgi:hypothetical protein